MLEFLKSINYLMKKAIHPTNYRTVLFRDVSNGNSYLIGATGKCEETITGEDGKEYPVFETEVSSSSHPHYTGEHRVMDSAGRADRFNARIKAAEEKKVKGN